MSLKKERKIPIMIIIKYKEIKENKVYTFFSGRTSSINFWVNRAVVNPNKEVKRLKKNVINKRCPSGEINPFKKVLL